MRGFTFPTLALPADVSIADTLWAPDRTEVELERLLRLKAEWDRDWLTAQTQRLAAVAMEVDRDKRELELLALTERQDAWYIEAAKQTDDIAKLIAKYEDPNGTHAAMVARAEAAKKDMQRDRAKAERTALLSRGVVRGRRK
jgi:hypothetical protein